MGEGLRSNPLHTLQWAFCFIFQKRRVILKSKLATEVNARLFSFMGRRRQCVIIRTLLQK